MTAGGDRLRLFFEERLIPGDGMIRDLAARLDVSRQTVHNWLSGKSEPSMDTLRTMATVLNVPRWRIVAVLDGDGPK